MSASGGGTSNARPTANGHRSLQQHGKERPAVSCFQMPLHYPRYSRDDYEKMPEWRLDCLLAEYGLPVAGGVEEKRRFAMGAFLWQ